MMEESVQAEEKFEPELYCLRCQRMEWDEVNRCCVNFCGPFCPLSIRQLLAGIEVSCLVV